MDVDSLLEVCDAERLNKETGKFEWTKIKVVDVKRNPRNQDFVRCHHCHGQITIHNASVNRPHMKHKNKIDSKNCKSGQRFKSLKKSLDKHKLSEIPVK